MKTHLLLRTFVTLPLSGDRRTCLAALHEAEHWAREQKHGENDGDG
jgi:hypothetical protein